MKKYLVLTLTSIILLGSCQKDDLSWMQEIESIKAELANQKKLIEALQANANITGIETNGDSYTIKFSNGQSITLTNGKTPLVTIGDNGNWYINGEDTGSPSRGSDGADGKDGSDGITPTIEIVDGHWWINGKDTGIKAEGKDGMSAPVVISIVFNENVMSFYFSDGSVIDCSLEYLSSYPTNYQGDEFLVFNHVVCIGDSMTSGTFNTNGGYYNDSNYSFPAYLHKKSGVSIANWGFGGLSTKQWYDYKCNEPWVGFDCAIIQLGINDYYREQTDFTKEYLGKIVDKLTSENPGIKIFVSTIVKARSYPARIFDPISESIREFISLRNDCYLTDMAEYGHTLDEDAYNAGHLSALGYWRLAMDYYAYIGHIIHTDPNDFVNIQFIGTDKDPFHY